MEAVTVYATLAGDLYRWSNVIVKNLDACTVSLMGTENGVDISMIPVSSISYVIQYLEKDTVIDSLESSFSSEKTDAQNSESFE